MTAPKGWNAIVAAGTPWKSFVSTVVTVGTAATPLPPTSLSNRIALWIFNIGTVNLFVGDVNVGTVNDAICYPRQVIVIPVSDDVTLYGRVASGTVVVRTWEGM